MPVRQSSDTTGISIVEPYRPQAELVGPSYGKAYGTMALAAIIALVLVGRLIWRNRSRIADAAEEGIARGVVASKAARRGVDGKARSFRQRIAARVQTIEKRERPEADPPPFSFGPPDFQDWAKPKSKPPTEPK